MSQFIDKHYPKEKISSELDSYLRNGWYRMGQTMFTTHFIHNNDDFRSTLWLRQDLNDYLPSKSLRKLLSKLAKKYHHDIKPFDLDEAKEHLFQLYREDFPEETSASLYESLLDEGKENVFDSYEINIYEGDKLIAVSFFDRGEDSIASIMGIYDPAYKKDSLGLYSMLLELEYCKDNDIQFFYPGYVVPGNSRFDYKLRIGTTLDYYDLGRNDWIRYNKLDVNDVPMIKMRRKLVEAKLYFEAEKGTSYPYWKYPLFGATLFGYGGFPHINFPEWLVAGIDEKSNRLILLIFDPFINKYQLYICFIFNHPQLYFMDSYLQQYRALDFFKKLILIEEIVPNIDTILDVKEYLESSTFKDIAQLKASIKSNEKS